MQRAKWCGVMVCAGLWACSSSEDPGGAGATHQGGAGGEASQGAGPVEGGAGGEASTEVCNSGFHLPGDPSLECLSGSCCDEFNDCTANGSDPEGCTACFVAGGGPRCDAAIACNVESCSASAPGVCDSGLSTQEPELDACLTENCCQEYADCSAHGAEVDACLECFVDGGGPRCDAAIACASQQCETTQGVCRSGFSTGVPSQDECLSESCCEPFSACTEAGTDVDSCIDCFNRGGGALCDDALACAEASECLLPIGVCESGVTTGDPEMDGCLTDNCCPEFSACTGDGRLVDECVECIGDGGGPLCDDAIACGGRICGFEV